MTSLLRTENLVKRYGGLTVTDGVSLDIRKGELHAIIGPNGAGKTTLINQLSGELSPDSGAIWFGDREVTAIPISGRARNGLLRSYQITSIFDAFTVLENAVVAAMGTQEHAFHFWKPMLKRTGIVNAAQEALAATGMSSLGGTIAGDLGYGERRQLELAMALAAKPEVLLLDEPMAGMSPQESAVVVKLLQSLKGRYTIVLIEHDMDAVFSLADRISVLVYGRLIATGTPDELRNDAEVRASYLGDEAI
ncbi:MAG: ABC transporter ATP-binding protein [Pseudomonadota bacterium]